MIPCKECLLIPICRNKTWMRLTDDCELIKTYSIRQTSRISPAGLSYRHGIAEILKPTLWCLSKSGALYFTDEYISRIKTVSVRRELMVMRAKVLEDKGE